MKKILCAILALATVFTLSIGIAACGPSSQSNGGTLNQLNSVREIYGFSAASAGTIISAMPENDAADETAPDTSNPETPGTQDPAGSEVDELNQYMLLVESILSEGGFQITEETSDREGYAIKTTVTYTDMLGEKVAYSMYYDQTLIEDDDDDDDDDDEIEEEFNIEGIMIIEGNEYEIRGESSREIEGDESENETEFVVFFDRAAGSYMKVEHSFEQERNEMEQEYEYSVYENRKLVEKSVFEYEQEKDEEEILFRLWKTEKDGSVFNKVFYFERENDKDEITIRTGEPGNMKTYKVTISADEDGSNYIYEYAGGRCERHRR